MIKLFDSTVKSSHTIWIAKGLKYRVDKPISIEPPPQNLNI